MLDVDQLALMEIDRDFLHVLSDHGRFGVSLKTWVDATMKARKETGFYAQTVMLYKAKVDDYVNHGLVGSIEGQYERNFVITQRGEEALARASKLFGTRDV